MAARATSARGMSFRICASSVEFTEGTRQVLPHSFATLTSPLNQRARNVVGVAAELRIDDNTERRRYEVYVGTELAGFTDYHVQPALITLLHTEIEPAFEGQGIGSRFVAGILDDARDRGLRVLPI